MTISKGVSTSSPTSTETTHNHGQSSERKCLSIVHEFRMGTNERFRRKSINSPHGCSPLISVSELPAKRKFGISKDVSDKHTRHVLSSMTLPPTSSRFHRHHRMSFCHRLAAAIVYTTLSAHSIQLMPIRTTGRHTPLPLCLGQVLVASGSITLFSAVAQQSDSLLSWREDAKDTHSYFLFRRHALSINTLNI